jgi:hypothetical protein
MAVLGCEELSRTCTMRCMFTEQCEIQLKASQICQQSSLKHLIKL